MKRLTAILLVLVMMVSFAGVASAEVSAGDMLVYYGLYTVTEEYAETLYNRVLFYADKESPTESDLWMVMGSVWAYYHIFTLNGLEYYLACDMPLGDAESAAAGAELVELITLPALVEKYKSGEMTISEIIDELVDLVAPFGDLYGDTAAE